MKGRVTTSPAVDNPVGKKEIIEALVEDKVIKKINDLAQQEQDKKITNLLLSKL